MSTVGGVVRRPHRVLQSLVVVVVCAGVLVVSIFAALSIGLGVCGGDAGEAYASPDSTAGRFCTSTTSDAVLGAMALMPAVLALVIGAVGVVRRRWAWVAASAGLPLAAVFLAFVIISSLPS